LDPSNKIEKSKVNINTSGTEDKTLAIEVLNQIIETFDVHYLNYIEKTQEIILPLIEYKTNYKVRKESSDTLPLILKAVKNAKKEEALVSLTKLYLSHLTIQCQNENDISTQSKMLGNMCKIFENIEIKFLQSNDLNQLFDHLLKIFGDTEKKRRELLQKREEIEKLEESQEKEEKVYDSDESEDDDDYANDLEQDIEEIEDLLVSISDLIGILFKTHKELSLGIVERITKQILPEFFKNTSSSFELKMGIFLVDDMIEYLGQSLLQSIWKDLAFILVTYSNHEIPEIRQASVYGIGIFSKQTEAGFDAYADTLLIKLDTAINISIGDNDEEEHGHSKDNAISALGKIISFQGNHVKNIDTWIKKYLDYLPLSYDEGEGVVMHELLCNSIKEKHELFIGKNYCFLDQIVRIFSTIHKTKLTNESIDKSIVEITKQLAANSLTNELFKLSLMKLDEKLTKKIESILS